jgi:hypothetical protein
LARASQAHPFKISSRRRLALVRSRTRIHQSTGTQDHGAIVPPRRTTMFDPLLTLPLIVGLLAAFSGVLVVASI